MPAPLSGRKTSRSHRVNLGDREVITHGLPYHFWQDIYHLCLTASWPVFFAAIGGIFLLLNSAFGLLYTLGDKPIANLLPNGFLGAFFFSVETFATVGYGDMHPQTLYGHLISTVEIFVGATSLAIITGVMFARFSRPRARIICSRHPVIRPVDGKVTLMMRAANARQNVIVDASAKLHMIRSEVSSEGMPIRKLHDLKLVRNQHPIFVLGWNLMHIIDASSPMHGLIPADLEKTDTGFILTIDGVDETTRQTMQARFMFTAAQLRWNHAYIDLLTVDETGANHMDYSRFHDVRPLENPLPKAE